MPTSSCDDVPNGTNKMIVWTCRASAVVAQTCRQHSSSSSKMQGSSSKMQSRDILLLCKNPKDTFFQNLVEFKSGLKPSWMITKLFLDSHKFPKENTIPKLEKFRKIVEKTDKKSDNVDLPDTEESADTEESDTDTSKNSNNIDTDSDANALHVLSLFLSEDWETLEKFVSPNDLKSFQKYLQKEKERKLLEEKKREKNRRNLLAKET